MRFVWLLLTCIASEEREKTGSNDAAEKIHSRRECASPNYLTLDLPPTIVRGSRRKMPFALAGGGRSSVGRALEWHSRGQGFDSPRLHSALQNGIPGTSEKMVARLTGPGAEAVGMMMAENAGRRGNSSVGRAQPCQGWGRGFESRFPLERNDGRGLKPRPNERGG